MTRFVPAYLKLMQNGELHHRVEQAHNHLQACDLCARYCYVNRLESYKGAVCRTGEMAVVDDYGPHHGEEAPLSGHRGSGTIFFSWCNLRCVFCQNWQISHKGAGKAVTPQALAAMMLELQVLGCHNINLVSPSHVVAQILAAVEIAAGKGLRLPLVYNTGGYDSPEALALLDGVIDIYMPDMKYGDSKQARLYSRVRQYVAVNQAAVLEMQRQVGDLILDEQNIAQRGLLVRHLLLPGDISETRAVFAFIAQKISKDCYLNLMDQYHPCYHAFDYPPLNRAISAAEYQRALKLAANYGLRRLEQAQQWQ